MHLLDPTCAVADGLSPRENPGPRVPLGCSCSPGTRPGAKPSFLDSNLRGNVSGEGEGFARGAASQRYFSRWLGVQVWKPPYGLIPLVGPYAPVLARVVLHQTHYVPFPEMGVLVYLSPFVRNVKRAHEYPPRDPAQA